MLRIIKILVVYFTLTLPANALLVTPEQDIFDTINTVRFQKIAPVIINAIEAEDVEGDIMLNMPSKQKDITLNSNDAKYHISMEEFSLNKKSQRFKSVIRFGSATKNELITIKGRYKIMVEIPVLREKMAKGSVISEHDLTTVKIDKKKLRHNNITNSKLIAGKMLTRALQPFKPIRANSLDRKIIISKRDNVEVIFETPFIKLRTSGIALDNGAEGDLIRIRNVTSNKIVQAKIDNIGVVRVISTNNL